MLYFLFIVAIIVVANVASWTPSGGEGGGGGRKHRRTSVPLISVSLNVDGNNYLPRLLQSIDYPVDRVVIQVGNSDPKVIADIQRKVLNASLNLPHLKVNLSSIMAVNPGSANGFNFGLRSLLTSTTSSNSTNADDWVLVVNSDIAFYPGILGRIAKSVERHLSRDPLFGIGFTSLCCGGEWSAVVFTRRIINRIGYLDENYYPAYFEDDDYAMRVHLSGLHAARFNNTPLLHGTIDGSKDYQSGVAMAIYFVKDDKDPAVVIWKQLFEAGIKHSEWYMHRKWGIAVNLKDKKKAVDCKSVAGMNGGCEVSFRTPFNDTTKGLDHWTLDYQKRDEIYRAAGIFKGVK